MKRVLEGLEPQKVFYFFEEISKIPRGSFNEKAVSDWIVNFARERGLSVTQDESWNVVINRPASPGYENKKKIILQGHMDMVCEKLPEVKHDFTKDGIELVVDGEFLRANGTTLGADDGNALALCLALLDDKELQAPALQVIFTTAEESGFKGVLALDGALIDGDYLIGLDYSQDDKILVSCAGDVHGSAFLPVSKEKTENSEGKCCLEISLSGLRSGHSGIEIIKGRCNANKLMGGILAKLNEEFQVDLAAAEGGTRSNVIPAEAKMTVCFKKEDEAAMRDVLTELSESMKVCYGKTDPELKLSVCEKPVPELCYRASDKENLIRLLDIVPNGLQTYLDVEHTITESSSNLGIVKEKEGGTEFVFLIRSNSNYQRDELNRKMETVCRLCGAEYRVEGCVNAWEYNPDSSLIPKVAEIFEQVKGFRPDIHIFHAGVETGELIEMAKKNGKKLEAVNLGVKNYDVHTPKERMEIASIGKTYELLKAILREM